MFVKILFGSSPDVLTLVLSNMLYIGSIVYLFHKMWNMQDIESVSRIINKSALTPPTLGFIGAMIDVLIYAESVGGIQGGTPYTFMIAMNTIMSVPVTLLLFSIYRGILKRKFKKE